jgi:hypothetical protein
MLLYKVQLSCCLIRDQPGLPWWLMQSCARGGGMVDLLNKHHTIHGFMCEPVGNMYFIFALTDEDGYVMAQMSAPKVWQPFELTLPEFERTIESEASVS